MKKNGLFIRKSIHSLALESEGESHEMRRHLGAFNLTAIGIGAIIGAGIFVITGTAAADYAGPGIILSFILAAIVCVLAGLCYGELSSMIPVSGGAYSYSYISMGEFPAWLVGWSILAQYLFTASTVAVGWSGYLVSLLQDFGIALPEFLTTSPITYSSETGWGFSGALLNFPAIIMVGCIGYLISSGLKAATRFNNIMVVIKLSTIALFIAIGVSFIKEDNLIPLIPENTGVFGEFGISGILRGMSIVFFAYTGFDLVATLAQETIQPQKNLPRGILGSLGICALAYIATSLVLVGVVSYKLLGVPDPMAVALNAMGGLGKIKLIVKIAIIAGLSSVALGNLLAQSRVFFAMGKDGLLPPAFSKLHKKSKTPFFSSIASSGICLLISGIFPVTILGNLVSMSTLFIFGIVCLGVLILRYKHPEFHRPFKAPLVPFIPIAGILCCLASMTFLPAATWIQLAIWLAIGLATYFAYGIKNSKLRRSNG
jgi:APA family basic amino acid/polyamine antiporter